MGSWWECGHRTGQDRTGQEEKSINNELIFSRQFWQRRNYRTYIRTQTDIHTPPLRRTYLLTYPKSVSVLPPTVILHECSCVLRWIGELWKVFTYDTRTGIHIVMYVVVHRRRDSNEIPILIRKVK